MTGMTYYAQPHTSICTRSYNGRLELLLWLIKRIWRIKNHNAEQTVGPALRTIGMAAPL